MFSTTSALRVGHLAVTGHNVPEIPLLQESDHPDRMITLPSHFFSQDHLFHRQQNFFLNNPSPSRPKSSKSAKSCCQHFFLLQKKTSLGNEKTWDRSALVFRRKSPDQVSVAKTGTLPCCIDGTCI